MIHKTFGMIDKLVLAQNDEGILVNLFIGGSANIQFPWGVTQIHTETGLPWKGSYSLTVDKANRPFKLMLRVPGWSQAIRCSINGTAIEPEIENGYAVFTVKQGDSVAFTDPMDVSRIEAHPYVSADRGRVALARGPLIYCVEGIDNHGETDFTLAADPGFKAEDRPDLLGGIVIIRGKKQDGEPFTAVPLYTWDNRMAGKMNVWLDQEGKGDTWSTKGWENRLYRPYHPG